MGISLRPSPGAIELSCTSCAGDVKFQGCFSEDARVADVVTSIRQETGRASHLVLPNQYVIGLSDHPRAFGELLDSPPPKEKRKDPNCKNGLSYTKREFFKYYGSQEGQDRWAMAMRDEMEAACSQSQMEFAKAQNARISEAVSASRHECAGGELEIAAAAQSSQASHFRTAAEHAMRMSCGTSPFLPARDKNHKESVTTTILVVGFNKHPVEFTNAIRKLPLAQSLCTRGFEISPEWAKGAKILIEGLTPSMMQGAQPDFAPETLRCWHVVMLPENEKEVMDSLMGLKYRTRPREKMRTTITCQQEASKDQPCGSPGDDCEKSDEYTGSSLPEDLFVARTFIDVPANLRVGWSPRSAYTKSSNDKHGIEGRFENPRKWK